jgi:hypothetical protein
LVTAQPAVALFTLRTIAQQSLGFVPAKPMGESLKVLARQPRRA